MTYELYYHSTTLEAWDEHICHEGLRLQPVVNDLESGHDYEFLFEQLGLPKLGLCMWPACAVSEQLFHDFLFWKWAHQGHSNCVILQCQVPSHALLHQRFNLQGDTLSLTHTQSCVSIRDAKVQFHCGVPFAFLIEPLPRELIRPIRRVHVKVDNLPGDRFVADSNIPAQPVDYGKAKQDIMARQHLLVSSRASTR